MNNINTPIKRNSGLQAAEFHKVYKVYKVCKVIAKEKRIKGSHDFAG